MLELDADGKPPVLGTQNSSASNVNKSTSSGRTTKSLIGLTPAQILQSLDVKALSADQLNAVEADSYYCLSKIMEGV